MTRIAHPLPRLRAGSTATRRPGAWRPSAIPQQSCGGTIPNGQQAALTVDIEWDRPGPVVVVAGELDLVGGELFAAVLDHVRSTRPGPVTVDLSRVTFVDTHGLTPALGADVALVNSSRVVRRLLSLMGLPDVGAAQRSPLG
ncbi:STAS domain-containing protein [Blastococcus sp. LR1]|uniref:STAS domain-containing protein n=1 Tax=Blastococcus sp. LR1 TaxID=2877000 RepID=UPI001CC8F14D|nr:STAS domain-containing protein [Blastococcus sp. LR1]MCA0143627.1 STAS domain-containing protein [Blastococcus sp. LR1]